jgi:hypothetical protein
LDQTPIALFNTGRRLRFPDQARINPL